MIDWNILPTLLIASVVAIVIGAIYSEIARHRAAESWQFILDNCKMSHPFTGQTWEKQPIFFWWNDGGGERLTIGANDDGLYISSPQFLKFLRPPLFIPWSKIEAIEGGASKLTVFKVPKGIAKEGCFAIHSELTQKIKETVGNRWPGREIGSGSQDAISKSTGNFFGK